MIYQQVDYPVSLNVTYSDNLRMVHELLLNDTVVYEGQPSTSGNNDGNNASAFTFANGFSGIFPMVIIIIIAIIVGLFLIRRRNKRKKNEKRINAKITSASRHSDSNTTTGVTDQDSDIFLDDESTSKNKP